MPPAPGGETFRDVPPQGGDRDLADSQRAESWQP